MNKSYSKSELAELAGVSYSTFNRYLKSRREILSKLGSQLKAKTLRGQALKYICEDYNITLPEESPPKRHQPFR